jgi:hypothetical protein
MHHPNMRDLDVRGMDFDRFVAESVSLNANAVVISAGGIIAFYPSDIPGHQVSDLLEGRDFIGEVTTRAKAAGLRVIARVDFSSAQESVASAHPDWLARNRAGAVIDDRGIKDVYATCPNSPYRGDGFAGPVLEELLGRYPIDGFHVNAGGWPGYCHCQRCQDLFCEAVGGDLPEGPDADPLLWARYVEWRYDCITASFAHLQRTAEAARPGVFWMGEFGLRWGSYDLPRMTNACSTLLVTTGNVVANERNVRSWAGLAARLTRTVMPDVQPLINLKVFVRSGGWPRSMVPPNEYRLWLWQTLANGGVLKTPVFGTLDQEDTRNLPAIEEAFSLIKRHPDVFVEAKPIAPVAVVWPRHTWDHWRGAFGGGSVGSGSRTSYATATNPFDGMYTALLESHVPIDVLADGQLTAERLAKYQVVVLPGVACLSDEATAAIEAFAEAGGGLLITGWTGWADALGQPRAVPALAKLGGVKALDRAALTSPGLYLAPVGAVASPTLAVRSGLEEVGLITADGPAPAYKALDEVTVSWQLVRHQKVLPVEAIDAPIPTGCAGVVLRQVGKGRIATVAAPIDAAYWRWRLGDHRQVLTNLVAWCAGITTDNPWPIQTEAPSTVEVTLSRLDQPRRYFVHFVNATGPEPLQDLIPVGSGMTRVRLDPGERCSGVRHVLNGAELSFTTDGDVVSFEAGQLAAYDLVAIEVE